MSTTSTTRIALRTRLLAGLAVLVAVGIGITNPMSASGRTDNDPARPRAQRLPTKGMPIT